MFAFDPHTPASEQACQAMQDYWATGLRVPAEHFLSEAPQLSANPEAVLELVLLEVELREEAGEAVLLEELQARFPSLAEPLRLQAEYRISLRQEIAVAPPATPETPKIPVGSVCVGGYEILREIGRGGMGIVYEAKQLALNRRVALKMISAPLASQRELCRINTEAEAVSRLQHANIVQIFEVGTHQGQPYLAFELVEGGTLSEKLRNGVFSPSAAAEMVETLARAIHVVHQNGILHRDLKPMNVLFTEGTPSDRIGIPKISDFGLAKLVDVTHNLTHTGETIGTPAYIAPEQVIGSSDIGPAADIYGLGTILYESLTGRPPFSGVSMAEILLNVNQSDPLPMSQFCAGIPRDLQSICYKCLDKSPKKRYLSAAALADDLQRFLSGEAVLARPVSGLGRVLKTMLRYPVTSALIALVFVTIIIGLGGVLFQWQKARQAREELRAALVISEEERDKAELRLYVGRISQAVLLWESGNVEQARELLMASVLETEQRDLRGWEWYHLNRVFHPEMEVHHYSHWVNSMALLPTSFAPSFAPNSEGQSKLLLAIGRKLMNNEDVVQPGDGQAVVLPPFNSASAQNIDLSIPGGLTAVAVDASGTLTAWGTTVGHLAVRDIGAQSQVFETIVPRGVNQLLFSIDGQLLLVGSNFGSLYVWETQTGEMVREIRLRDDGRVSLALSPDGTHVACGTDQGGRLSLVKLGSWEPVEVTCSQLTRITSLAYAPQEDLLAVGADDGKIELLEMSPPRVVRTWKDHSGPVYAMAFHPLGHLLASGGADHVIRVWKVGSQEIARKIRSHSDAVRTLTFGPDGTWLASGSQDATLRIHDLQQEPATLHLPFKEGVNAITFVDSPNGVSLYADRLAGDIRGWALPDCNVVVDSTVPPHGQGAYPVRYADFMHQGGVLVSLSAEDANRIDFHDVISGQPIGPPLRATHSMDTFVIDQAVDWLAWAERFDSDTQTIHWRELSTGMNHGPVVLKAKLIRALALDATRGRLAVMMRLERSAPSQLMIIDTTGQTKPIRLMVGQAMYGGVAFSPTDGTLAVAVDGQAYLFDPSTWQVLGQFSCATTTTHISFSPDGRRLATIGYDGIVHIASTDGGTPLLQLRGSNASARPNNLAWDARVAFSSDGAWLAANNWDGSLTVWSTRE